MDEGGGRAAARPSRRRFISITAGLAGLAIPGANAWASTRQPTLRWRGRALGAMAQIQLPKGDPADARRILAKCRDEIARLEALFSLYDPDSALSRLNRTGELSQPDFDFLRLLSVSQALTQHSSGAFDVTIQPLWQAYWDHYSTDDADPSGPTHRTIDDALRRVGANKLLVSTRSVRFARDGMSISLNGIAQGYVTDRIAGLLRRHGCNDVLVHVGETIGLGQRPDGRPWTAGIDTQPGGRGSQRIALNDVALATSAASGTPFTTDGRHHHLFDPRTGQCTQHYASVSVMHRSAAIADGLSTALSALDSKQAIQLIDRYAGARAHLVRYGGRTIEIGWQRLVPEK